MADQNFTTPPPADSELEEFSRNARSSNPIFDEDVERATFKATSVLYLLKSYILKEEDQGIAEEHAVASSMILQVAINALELQMEYQERKAKIAGGAA